MNLALTVLAVIIWGLLAYIWMRRVRERRAFEKLSITPEALHDLHRVPSQRARSWMLASH